MANNIYIPYLLPLAFYDKDFTQDDQYGTKHMDDFLFSEQLQDFEQPVDWHQVFSVNDAIKLQIESNYDPITVEIWDNTQGIKISDVTMTKIRSNPLLPGYFIYESQSALTGLSGCYYMKIVAGDPVLKTFISEKFKVSSNISKTVLIEYSNTTYKGNLIFETGIVFQMRLQGFIKYKKSGRKEQLFEDQQLDLTVLDSRPFDIFTFFIGAGAGVPPYMEQKLAWVFSCDNILLDGKPFTKAEGDFEQSEEKDYPMKGLSIDLRPSIRRGSKVFTSDGTGNVKLVLVGNIESKGFGDVTTNGSSDIVQITEIE